MGADPIWKKALRSAKGAALRCVGRRSAWTEARWINRFGRGGYDELALETPLRPEAFVMDVGSYSGNWAAAIHRRYGCRIWLFEPVSQFYQEAAARFASIPHCRAFPIGLAGKSGQAEIGVSGVGSSVFGLAEAKETIQLRDIADFFSEHDIRSVDCMAINIEGGEFDLLERLIETNLVGRCLEYHIQFHRVVPDAERRRNSIRHKLAETHVNTLCYPFIWEIWRRK